MDWSAFKSVGGITQEVEDDATKGTNGGVSSSQMEVSQEKTTQENPLITSKDHEVKDVPTSRFYDLSKDLELKPRQALVLAW